jgi:hypothetical protein
MTLQSKGLCQKKDIETRHDAVRKFRKGSH